MSKAKPGLLDQLKSAVSESAPTYGPRCAICKLPADMREWIDGELRSGVQAKTALAAGLRKVGYPIFDHTVLNHQKAHVR